MNICTIVSANYVAQARALAISFTAQHPGQRCFALLIDDFELGPHAFAGEPFEAVAPADLSLSRGEFDEMRLAYDLVEFATALKPWLLRWTLDHGNDGSGVAYFDPDIVVYSPMAELQEALDHSQIVLTPHLTAPMPRDGMAPTETDIMLAGIYNLGFVGVAPGAESDAFLDWWRTRLRTDCVSAPERGLFVDQRWVDWVPGLFKELTILQSPTYNVAYWNIPTRTLDHGPDGYTVDGEPLRFFHFSGYSPLHPTALSRHQNRVVLVPGSPLQRIVAEYGEQLLALGFEEATNNPRPHGETVGGIPLDQPGRALVHRAATSGVLTGARTGAEREAALIAWMADHEPQAPGLTRYLYALWSARTDLRSAFPDPTGADHSA